MKNTQLAILSDIYKSELSSFVQTASQLKSEGITKLVIDLSSVPKEEKLEYMSLLIGVFISEGIETRYTGIDKKITESADWGIHRRYALQSVHENLESAVQSFSKSQ